MSSFPGYKGYSQIDSRSEYLIAITDASGIQQAIVAPTIANSNYIINYDGTVLNTTNATAVYEELLAAGSTNVISPIQFRDMGRIIYIQQNGIEVFKLRLLQPVNGPLTEGVPNNYPTANTFVCVWSADPSITTIHVARSG